MTRRILTGPLAALMMLWGLTLSAMPNFARQYKVECSTCHTVIPRLNEVGYNFRAAGFRMPDEIGKEDSEPGNLINYFAARLQSRYDLNRTNNAGTKSSKNQLGFEEVTLYPATGHFFKNYSSLFELSLAPENPTEIENAYLRGAWNYKGGFASARVGIFHPFEGYGASDRPMTIDRPFIQRMPAKFNQSTFFTPWGFDESGLELGYTLHRTSVRATVFNGLTYSPDENNAIPATGGGGTKTSSRPGYNNKDFQLFFNQILTENGGGVSLFYYKGSLALPVGDQFFRNSFDRWAAYGSYPVTKPLLLLAGVQQGKDDTFNTQANSIVGSSTSRGLFVEADYVASPQFGYVARYDMFDPSTRVGNNKASAVTLGLNHPLDNGVQAIAQYQHRVTQQVAKDDKKDDTFQIRFIWIF